MTDLKPVYTRLRRRETLIPVFAAALLCCVFLAIVGAMGALLAAQNGANDAAFRSTRRIDALTSENAQLHAQIEALQRTVGSNEAQIVTLEAQIRMVIPATGPSRVTATTTPRTTAPSTAAPSPTTTPSTTVAAPASPPTTSPTPPKTCLIPPTGPFPGFCP